MKMLQGYLHWIVLCFCCRFLSTHCVEVCNEDVCHQASPDPVAQSARGSVSSSASETQNIAGICVADGRTIPLGEKVHRTGVGANGVKAIDLCFVVSAAQTMQGSQRWTQTAVPYLEQKLRAAGIGSGEYQNQYCLTMFGSRGRFLKAQFLKVENETFFPADKFPAARRQLRRNGDVADGYQAVEFTALNAPFREDPNIAKVIVLVTDMGRTVLAASANLTREVLSDVLHERGLVFDAIISADIKISDTPQSTRATNTVLGIHSFNSALVLRDNGGFDTVQGNLYFTSSAGNTIYDYVALTFAMDSCTWPLQILSEGNGNTFKSFAAAFVDAHHFTPLQTFPVCEKCVCLQEGHSATLDCRQPLNQELCYCLINGTALECSTIIPTPTAVLPPITSLLAPTQSPVMITIDGNVTVFPDGDAEITFQSNVDKVSFECVRVADDEDMPEISPCSSPYLIKALPEGEHRLIVIGRKWGQQATKLFTFEIDSDDPFDVMAEQLSTTDVEGNVLVNFTANRQDVDFQCSLGGDDFTGCQSPHLIDPTDLQLEELASQIFIVVATDRRGNAASAIITITPPPPPTSELPTLTVAVWVDEEPDLFGILRIYYQSSIDEASCTCMLDGGAKTPCRDAGTTGRSVQEINPRDVSSGDHTFRVTCMFNDTADSDFIKFNLLPAPPPPMGPLNCSLNLTPSDEGTEYFVDFSCNRRVIITLCQISTLPPMETCQSEFQFSTSNLEPGIHKLFLEANDGYGGSREKIFQFEVSGGRRRCCPEILPDSTALSSDGGDHTHVELLLSVAAGNCSQSEGFSYVVHWGDGSRDSGNSTLLGAVSCTKEYSSPSVNYQIEAQYCNNPLDSSNKCCDSLSLPVDLPQQDS